MAVYGSGIRDTARVLSISTNTVMKELKKESLIEKVNKKWLKQRHDRELEVSILKVEVDEMQSFVAKKEFQRWL